MSGATHEGDVQSEVEIAIELRLSLDDGARTFLQIGLNLFQRSVRGLPQRDATYNGC